MEELKIQLQQELRKDGTVESMKTQLRYKLLERLQLQQQPKSQGKQEDNLSLRVVASLIADHLKIQKLDYCLSVFLPECGYNILNQNELKLLLKVETDDSVLQTLTNGLLMIKPKEIQKYNSSTQTFTGDAIMNLEERLNYVDTSFRQKMEGELLKPHQDMEQRMLKWKKEYDLRWKAEMNAEISRIKEFECAQIRIEETEKQTKKMEEYREQLEKNYQEKLSKLRDREKDALERASSKMKEIEGLNYHYRQKIMRDHEMIKLKEQELKKQQELNEEQLRTTQYRLEDRERELKKRLFEVQCDQDEKSRKHKDELDQSKSAAMGQFSSEREEMIQKQKKLDAELKKIENLKQTIENLQNDNKDLISENEKYVQEIRQLKKAKKEAETDCVRIIHKFTFIQAYMRDQLNTMTEVQRKDQDLLRKYESDLKLKEDELKVHQTTIEHKQNMMVDHKDLHNEAIKKLNREIQGYQQRLEKQDVIIKQLREELHEKDNQFPNLLMAQQTMQQGGTVMDSLLFGYNEQDHQNRLKLIHNELEENRLKRQEEIRKLREEPIQEGPKHQIRFDKIWDIHNSSVDIQKSDPMNIFKFGEETQSQMLQSGLQRNQANIIEETYEDLT